jgi:hypothetical protein
MITIGATAGGYVPGEDATAISAMNKGLVDRFKEKIKLQATQNNNTKGSSSLEESYKEELTAFNTFVSELGSLNGNTVPKWNSEAISAFSNAASSLFEYDQAKQTEEKKDTDENAASPNGGFLPFDLSLTMDGLSGMKVYQKYIIDTTYLPSNYPTSLEFLIKGITNTIQNNEWNTTLESIAIPKNPFGSKVGKGAVSQASSNSSTPAGNDRDTTRGTAPAVAGTCKTAYPNLPFTNPRPGSDLLSYKTAATYLNTKYGSSLGKAVFAILFAEASKSGNNFRSAGGHNYAGVQTDNAKWGAPGIIGQYCRIDSGGVARAFAIFASDETFLDFMANRIKAKGFDGDSGDKWVTTYILSWWSPKAKKEYAVKGSEKYNSKLSIYNSAIKRYNDNIA